MRTIIISLLLTICIRQVFPQAGQGVEINHIFFSVDSETYNELFKDDFLTKTLADTREFSSGTITDSWTGKYIYGRNSFIEIFTEAKVKNTSLQLGDKFGDLAIVFKTKKSGDINELKSLMDSLKVSTNFETTEFERNGQLHKWNHILFINRPLLHDNFRPYVEEKTKELLLSRGFSETEIVQNLTEEKFREKVRGRKFDKLFDKIKSIDLRLSGQEFDYLSETLKYFGFVQRGQIFSNDELVIKCKLSEGSKFRVERIGISLGANVGSRKIKISDHLILKARKNEAQFIFNYD